MKTIEVPVPRLCRLERFEGDAWTKVGDYSLLRPDRYPQRLAEKGKLGRATVLDDHLQPTSEVYAVEVNTCPVCSNPHGEPYDGSCLI